MNKLLSDWHVDSAHDLVSVLEESRVDVPGRGDGRTSTHTEPWILAHFLSTLAAAGQLRFPLRWCKRERPDYVVSWAGRDRGIEISEMVAPAFAHAAAIRNEELPDLPIDASLFRPGVAPGSREEVRGRLRGGITGFGWNGDSVEHEWADAVVDRTARKSANLIAAGYALYPENWLLLYDNLLGPLLDLHKAVGLAEARLAPFFERRLGFSSVWVMSHGQLVSLDGLTVRVFPIVPPWTRRPVSSAPATPAKEEPRRSRRRAAHRTAANGRME